MIKKQNIGTSGYSYKHWSNGVFYPQGLRQTKWLEYYCNHLDSVELNVSFYRLPSLKAFRNWHQQTPANFSFAVKGSRYITHIKRLKDPTTNLKHFFSNTKPLKEKLAVVLWQLPPNFKMDLARLQHFVKQLVKLRPCPQVFEFRHQSWFCTDIFKLLKENNIAICNADWPEYSQTAPSEIADFVYFRRHGTTGQPYSGCYSDEQLKQDANLIKNTIKKKKSCFFYFNNDTHGWAIKNTLKLKEMLQ